MLQKKIEEDTWYRAYTEEAISKGYEHRFFQSELHYDRFCVKLNVRDGMVYEWVPVVAYLLNEKVRALAEHLPDGHDLNMRWVFIDNHAAHSFGVDYDYSAMSAPVFTEQGLQDVLSDSFGVHLFEPVICINEIEVPKTLPY